MPSDRGFCALRRAVSVVFLFAFATPAAALAAADDVRSLEVESYRHDHGVSAQVAARNLATQQRGTGIVQRLEAVQDDRYAGVWFDNEAGEFVVPVLGERSRASAKATLATAGLTGNYRTVPAEHSWEELKAAHTRLDAELSQLVRENTVRTSLDPRTNAVVVERAAGASGGEAAAIGRLAAEQNVRVEVRPRKAVSPDPAIAT